jgi:hypothetical protein
VDRDTKLKRKQAVLPIYVYKFVECKHESAYLLKSWNRISRAELLAAFSTIHLFQNWHNVGIHASETKNNIIS